MKRWGVFDTPSYYPLGGMQDFVACFETKEEAKLFVSRSDRTDLLIEDMNDYLLQESPSIPSKEEWDEKCLKKKLARVEALKDPLQNAMYRLARSLETSFYGKVDE